ncbi:gluconokinase [Planoprotostelium fungivorum]|uniref:gluconokinase n=1 Tax=Planoprotostelium fungivorum TaxID=1890364 RepID=A0A2P6NWB8_9EUKA|nr:gluconokinase [Planoprotostelium fungivorum]
MSSILDVPLLPLFNTPLFTLGYPRGWTLESLGESVGTPDSIYYRQMSPQIGANLAEMIYKGIIDHDSGIYLLQFESRLIWLELTECGHGYYRAELRGLPLREVDSQDTELSVVDSIFSEDGLLEDGRQPKTLNGHFWNALQARGFLRLRTYSLNVTDITDVMASSKFMGDLPVTYIRTLTWVLWRHTSRYLPPRWKHRRYLYEDFSKLQERFPAEWLNYLESREGEGFDAEANGGTFQRSESTVSPSKDDTLSHVIATTFISRDGGGYRGEEVYKMHNGQISEGVDTFILTEDRELKRLAVLAMRYAIKLVEDETVANTFGELQDALYRLHSQFHMGDEGDDVESSMMEGKPNIVTLSLVEGRYMRRIRSLGLQRVAVGRLNDRIVQGLWAARSLQRLYLGEEEEVNANQEWLLRNLIHKASPSPWGEFSEAEITRSINTDEMTGAPHVPDKVEAFITREEPIMVLMGVSASGKTTIGEHLAKRTCYEYTDADSFHPESNIRKMRSGEALVDDDRWPWLKAMFNALTYANEHGEHLIYSCSGLKRLYRDALKGLRSIPPSEEDLKTKMKPLPLQWIYLKGSKELIADRISKRSGHFMKPEMLDSQFAALEEPTEDEGVIIVDIDNTPDGIVEDILNKLKEKHKHITEKEWEQRFQPDPK